jgi:hypothetical protein
MAGIMSEGSGSTTRETSYVLGSDQQELARLDRQAAMVAPATRLFLQAAGIAPGMRARTRLP